MKYDRFQRTLDAILEVYRLEVLHEQQRDELQSKIALADMKSETAKRSRK